MWQPEDDAALPPARAPAPWAELRAQLDRRLVGAYCAMRFDGKSRGWVMRELGFDEGELEAAIRRGADVYGHDVETALRAVGRPPARRVGGGARSGRVA